MRTGEEWKPTAIGRQVVWPPWHPAVSGWRFPFELCASLPIWSMYDAESRVAQYAFPCGLRAQGQRLISGVPPLHFCSPLCHGSERKDRPMRRFIRVLPAACVTVEVVGEQLDERG